MGGFVLSAVFHGGGIMSSNNFVFLLGAADATSSDKRHASWWLQHGGGGAGDAILARLVGCTIYAILKHSHVLLNISKYSILCYSMDVEHRHQTSFGICQMFTIVYLWGGVSGWGLVGMAGDGFQWLGMVWNCWNGWNSCE